MPVHAAPSPRLSTLVLLTALSVLSLNMFLPSLGNIAADFQADYSLVSLSVAGYLGVTAIVQLLVGPLSDRFGRRPVLLAALALFVLASITGATVGTQYGAYQLLGMMLFCSLAGLSAALYVARLERRTTATANP